jgi:PKD repeat protein/glucose/arabinose dehydrogenase
MVLALVSLLLAAPLWAAAPGAAGAAGAAPAQGPEGRGGGAGGGHDHGFKVLVFTKGASRVTADAGVDAIRKLGRDLGFTVDATDDARRFNERHLERYRVVVFLDTTGVVLDDAGRTAFEAYFRDGGGFVGIGSAIETEPDWPFLTDVLGTRAQGRTAVQTGTIKVADRGHDATEDLPEYWTRTDAWYNFTSNVRGFSHVLATVVEQPFARQPWGGTLSAIAGGTMGADHPVSWCKDFQGGRSFYTALGTRAQSFGESKLRTHLGGAIRWAAGRSDPTYSDCGATVLANYQQTKLAAPPNVAEPIGFDVLPDGRVLQTDRLGGVRLHDPATNTTTVLATIPVYTHSEDGMYGPAIDDDFATNRWVYLYYAPPTVEDVKLSDGRVVTQTTPTAAAPNTAASVTAWDPYVGYFQLSRFKLVDGATPHLDLASEQQILRVPVNRGACCHVAGDIDFDDRGNLWMVTGDDTPAGGGGSGGFAPFNDQLTADGLFNAPHVDARRSALNTNDLRGKVLRIAVDDDDIAAADENRLGGAYTVPRGNLFAPGTAATRPEIYAMGLRNPFRIQVDGDGVAYVADYSPDSRVPQVDRGPAGTGRIIAVREPANYGWPLCYRTDLAYYRWNFVTSQPLDTPAQRFSCGNPRQGPPNDSRWNVEGGPTVTPGRRQTPPVTNPDVWYSFDDNNAPTPLGTPCSAYYDGTLPAEQRVCPQLFPEMGPGGGVGPHTTAVYEYDRHGDDPTRLPPYFDGALFFGEFTRDYLREIRLDAQDRVFKINSALDCGGVRTPASQRFGFECDSPMDAQFDEDGHFYLLAYGDGFFQANADAGLYRWDYVKGQRAPIAELSATPTSGQAPLVVQFSSEGSRDPDPADSIAFEWDFDGDGTVDSVDPNPTFTYTANGTYVARLTVTDSSGRTAAANTTITVGNTAPTVTVDVPTEGGLFAFGESIPFSVTVTDPEDGSIDCSRVSVTFVLAHDSHGHAEDTVDGCSGTLATIADDAAHGGNVWGVVRASYTDLGGGGSGGVPALTTVAQANVRQKRMEVEFVLDESGTNVQTTNDPDGGGQHRGSLSNGDWVRLNGPYDLEDIDGLTFRVASTSGTVPAGSPMAAVEVRLDAVDGPLLTTAGLVSTGAAGTWASQTVPIADPGGLHQIYLVFRSVPGGQGGNNLFNLNWAQFEGQGVAG